VKESVVNRQELVDVVSEEVEVSKASVNKVLDALLRAVKDAVAEGAAVQLIGFGSFAVADRPARTARDPKTDEPIEIAAGRTVRFTAGKAFKDAVNAR